MHPTSRADPPPATPPWAKFAGALESNGWLRFSFVLGLILLLKWDTLVLPPVWDTAMGLFPAALTLADNGFDLIELLGMPAYAQGGPNVHGLSPVTWITALVLWMVGGGTQAFVVLHLLHFAAAAWALLGLFRLARPALGPTAASLLCVCVLLHPVLSAQVGFLYLEIPLFLATVMALLAWAERRFWPAVVWATLAYATKETGVIVPAALVILALLEGRVLTERLRRVGRIAVLPVLWTGLVAVMNELGATRAIEGATGPSLDAVFGGVGQYLARFLLNVPDLILYFVVFFVTAVVCLVPIVRSLRSEPDAAPGDVTKEHHTWLVLGYTGVVTILFVLLFMVVLPVAVGFTVVLPRYYVMVLPFLLLWMGVVVDRLVGRRFAGAASWTFVALSVVFALNTDGALYPIDINTEGPGNDPALTERSNAYRRLQRLEFEAIQALEALPEGVPVYYGRYEHYLLQYPGLGYSSGPLSNGHDFSVESLADVIRGDPMPPCAYALFNYPWLGGEKILGLIRFAEKTPGMSSDIVQEFRDGLYVITLARIRTGDADCPA